jgi:hypothetical protein
MSTPLSYYHVTWNDPHHATTYYVEGKKCTDGSIFSLRYKAVSHLINGKRVKFRTSRVMGAGIFPSECIFRKLKKNPFNS